MTYPEALLVLFDTVFWALENNLYKDKKDKDELVGQLRDIIGSIEPQYVHEPYKKVNGVWTHSGSFQYFAIANNCQNKRASFLVILRGALVTVTDNVRLFKEKQWFKLEPNEVRTGLVKEDSRIMRVFVNTEDELKTFLEAM